MNDLETKLNSIVEESSEDNIQEVIDEDTTNNEKENETVNNQDDMASEKTNNNSSAIEEENPYAISETFANLVRANEMAKEISSNNEVSSILNSIQVDLSSIEIVDNMNPLELNALEESIFNDKTTMLVTCCQSSYTAEMSALKSQDIQNLANSDVDYYTYKKKLFQLINKHMENTSVGKLEYNQWLNVTSYFDIETLLYGLYCQTFNYQNKYSINCPKCKRSFDAVVNNTTLVELRGKDEGAETFAKIQEIVKEVKNADELLAHSHVHKTKRIILDESKTIFDIRIPSVYNYLEDVVAKSDDRTLEEYQNALGLNLFVNKVYLPNILLYKQTGQLKYVEVGNDNRKRLNIIGNLSYYDSIQLSDEINDFVDKFRITYSIRNVTCPHCGHVIKQIPIDLEEMLFYTIRQGRIEK
jgi:hypothetical protein